LAVVLAGCGAAPDASFDDRSVDTDDVSKGGGGGKGGGGTPQKIGYLALGDSIAFGFSPLVTTPANPGSYKGYPEVLGGYPNVALDNASCPGETSGSLLSADATVPDNGCRAWKAAYSLHANYETTQIAFAESYIASHNDTTKFVTIDIGANDLLLVQKDCLGDPACIQTKLPGVLGAYGQNLGATFARLRAKGFTGKFVSLSLYATNYNDPLAVPAITALNQVMSQVTAAAGGVMADGFGAFQGVAAKFGNDACAAGLLIEMPDGTCDIHPSTKGRDALAAAIVAVAK
jgi:hypothetical protein